MGYFALIVLRRWRKWARREAGLRHLFEKLGVWAAVRRWKEAVKLTVFQALLRRLAVRKALQRWKRKVEKRTAFETAHYHYARNLVSKVRWDGLASSLPTLRKIQYTGPLATDRVVRKAS